MSLPHTNLKSPAHTLGLELEPDSTNPGAIHLTRHGQTITLSPEILRDLNHPDAIHQRFIQTSALTGIRLALDQLEITRQAQEQAQQKTAQTPTQPSAPIRAGGPQPKVVRYHEVASVYGERFLRLFSTLSLDWCEAITQQKLYRLPWLQDGFEITFTEEHGRTLDLLTLEQADANPDPDKRLRDARAALFYESYRVRPSQKLSFDSGIIKIIRTTEGLGASRALILPEFDWDASQDHGFLAIPDRDTLLIAHPSKPNDPASRAELHKELQNLIRRQLHQTFFPLSNATFDLNIDQTTAHPTPPTNPLPAANYPPPPNNLTVQPACKNLPS